MTKKSYSLKEASELTGFSVATLRKAINNNELAAFRTSAAKNSKQAIRAHHLEEWLDYCEENFAA